LCEAIQTDAAHCENSEPHLVTPTGLEPKYVTTCGDKELQNPSPESGAESGAVSPLSGRVDARLQRVIDAWPNLPEAVKAGIVAMVKARGSNRTP